MAEAGAQRMLEWLTGVPGWLAVLLVVAVVLAEPALLVGMVLPSVGAAVFLGFLSSLGVVPLAGAVVAVALAAVVGDGLAFRSGRQRGMARAAATGWLARRTQRGWARIGQWYERTGPWAIPLARWITGARTLVPRAAAAGGLSWTGFLARSVPAAMVWAATLVTAGSVVGASYARLTAAVGRGSGAVVLLAGLAAGVIGFGRWAGHHADVLAQVNRRLWRLLPEPVVRRLAAPAARRTGAVITRWVIVLAGGVVLTALAVLGFHAAAALVRLSGLAALDGWTRDRSAALGSSIVEDGALTVASALRPSFVVPALLCVAGIRWALRTYSANGRGGLQLIVTASLAVGGLIGVAVQAVRSAQTQAMAAPLTGPADLFPVQLFLMTAVSLTAAGLLTDQRPVPLRSAAVTVAALVALGVAAARVQVGWDQPSTALVGLLVGGLWALLVLSLRSAVTAARTETVPSSPAAGW